MPLYCLDTNILVAILRGKSQSLAAHLSATPPESILISEIVRAELEFGCYKSSRKERNLELVQLLLAPFATIPFANDAVSHYADIRSTLEKSGNTIGPVDLFIAATARSLGATIVTDNVREFERVPDLIVENWI